MSDDNATHPGLEGYSRTGEQVKHTLGKALKFAAWGAVLLGVGMMVPFAPMATLATGISSVFGLGGAASIGSSLLTLFAKGAIAGGAIGGALGLARGLSGASAAADDEEEKRIASYERREVRNERLAALEMQRAQQGLALARQARELGVGPGVLPGGKGVGGGRHA